MIDRASPSALGSVALLAALGCSMLRPWPDTLRSTSETVFPLAPGSSWVYDVADAEGRVSKFRARVSGEVYLDARRSKVTLVEESGGVPGAPTLESSRDLVAYTSHGGLIFRFPWRTPESPERETAGEEEPVLPEDPERDRVWRGSYSILPAAGSAFYDSWSESRLASTDDSVVVPAGTFRRCLRVETTIRALVPSSPTRREIIHYYTEWYAPGVGLVKARSFVDVEGERAEILQADLTSFRRGAGR